jgi:hypothetical protein
MRKKSLFGLAVVVVLLWSSLASAEEAPVFKIVKESRTVAAVYVENAEEIGAFEVTLSFNPRIKIKSIVKGELISQSARSFTMVGPKMVPGHKVTFGFFSLGSAEGIYGRGAVARINFTGSPASFKILKVSVTDSKGKKIGAKF